MDKNEEGEYITINVNAILELIELGDKLCDHGLSRDQHDVVEVEWRGMADGLKWAIQLVGKEKES